MGWQRAGDTSSYVGHFHQGKRHGRGVFTFANGDRYWCGVNTPLCARNRGASRLIFKALQGTPAFRLGLNLALPWFHLGSFLDVVSFVGSRVSFDQCFIALMDTCKSARPLAVARASAPSTADVRDNRHGWRAAETEQLFERNVRRWQRRVGARLRSRKCMLRPGSMTHAMLCWQASDNEMDTLLGTQFLATTIGYKHLVQLTLVSS